MKARTTWICGWLVVCVALLGSAIAVGQAPTNYWNFNNSGNVGQATVSTDLTASNGAAYTASGKFGGGVALDGADDYLGNVFPAGTPVGGSAYTISAWIRPTANGNRGIVGWGNYGTGNQVNALRLNSTADVLNYWWGADQLVTLGSPNLYDGNWHHIVASHNGATGGTRSIWVDGTLVGQMAAGAGHNVSANNFRIGSTNNGEYFAGTIDDVAIYNSALTGNQIDALFTGGASPTSLPAMGATSRWFASDLNAQANNSPVATWTDSIAGANLANATVGAQPLLVKNATPSGASAVRFDGVNDQLRLPAAVNALSGNVDFSVAVSLRSTAAGAAGGQWYNNDGIVDGEVGGVSNDWGLVVNDAGRAGAGLGNPDVTTYGTTSITDGNIHTVLYTRDDNVLSLYVDGVLQSTSPGGNVNPLNFADLVVGSLQTNLNFYSGDIFEVRLFDFTLSASQAATLNAEMQSALNAPEPASVAIWTSIGLLGVAFGWSFQRRRRGQK